MERVFTIYISHFLLLPFSFLSHMNFQIVLLILLSFLLPFVEIAPGLQSTRVPPSLRDTLDRLHGYGIGIGDTAYV